VYNILTRIEEYPELKEFFHEIKGLSNSQIHVIETVMMAVLHDASEIYTGDIPSPVKQIPELRVIVKKVEHKLMSAIYQAFNLPEPTELQEKIIKHADKIAQKIEAHAFMQSRGNHWPNMPHISLEKLQKFESPKKALESYHEFMTFFNEFYNKYLIELSKAVK
jgi:5'-deoxynucleotidase YfbR-like HD superfamily hydrolase